VLGIVDLHLSARLMMAAAHCCTSHVTCESAAAAVTPLAAPQQQATTSGIQLHLVMHRQRICCCLSASRARASTVKSIVASQPTASADELTL
jgi:hypothetical protein